MVRLAVRDAAARRVVEEMVVEEGQELEREAPVDDQDESALVNQLEERQRRPWWRRPWWRRPTPWWQICVVPISKFAEGCTTAAKLELMNSVVCSELSPELSSGPSTVCSSDPKVQAGAASLIAVNLVLGGIVSGLMSPVWGSISDRRGRIFVQCICAPGHLVGDITFLLVYLFHQRYPIGTLGIYFSTIVGSFFIFGVHIASHAYVADVTEPDTRPRWFVLFTGASLAGSGLGPLIGSVIAHFTNGLTWVYAIAIFIHIPSVLATWFAIPESLVPAQMQATRNKHRREVAEHAGKRKGIWGKAWAAVWSAVEPLGIFLPSKHSFGVPVRKLEYRSWALTLVGLAYFPDTLVSGASVFYLQYGVGVFEWATEQIGVVISLASISKVGFLLVVLPVIIKLFRPTSAPQPSRSPSPSARRTETETRPLLSRARSHLRAAAHDRGVKWDLGLLHVSLIVQLLAISLLGISSRPSVFMLGIVAVSLGAGFVPTLQSFALELYRRRGGVEAGKLFGALTVLHVLGTQILGPTLFGITYARSVETIPKFIFWLGDALVACSIAVMFFVRVPPDYSKELATGNEAVDEEYEEEHP